MKKLLVIDDNDHQHELFRVYTMFAEDLEADHACSIDEALDYLKYNNDYDLIFLDNRLHPYSSYLESAPLLAETDFKGKLIVFSSDIDDHTVGQIDNFGVDDFVDKSIFSATNFKQIIESYV